MPSSIYQNQLCSERQEVRTLTLKQGAFDDPVHCALQTVSLVDNPKYTALSYVWGDVTDQLPIYVDETLFLATRNLKLALQHIRKTDRDEVMWVDAVCINQNDIDERNSQILLMNRLYSEAENVVIWLGEADDFTDELVRIVQETGLPTPPAPEDDDFVQSSVRCTVYLHRVMILILIIASRPWWSRVWTVQECILPRNDPSFRCGLQTFSCSKFFELVLEINNKLLHYMHSAIEPDRNLKSREIWQYTERLCRSIGQRELDQNYVNIGALGLLRKRFKETSRIGLGDSVLVSMNRQATLPHDYIYGILGLVTATERMKIRVDYGRPYWAVYRDIFRPLLEQPGPQDDLRILNLLSFHTTSNERPSWLPDLSSQTNVESYSSAYLGSKDCFRSLRVGPSNDEDMIKLEGLFLDEVDRVHAMQADHKAWLPNLFGMARQVMSERIVFEHRNTSFNGPPPELVDALKRTHISQLFLGNAPVDTRMALSAGQIEHHWDLLSEREYDVETAEDLERDEYSTPRAELGGISLQAFMVRIMLQTFAVCKGKNVMFSRAGLNGICVANTQPGDEIVCLYGFYMLFILRPMHGHYRIVGGVHLPGLMDWSILTECLEKGSLHEATFRIR
jgi:hypothetical protein